MLSTSITWQISRGGKKTMSKLVEKLQRISEGSIQPMGFGAAAARAKISPMLIIASLPLGNAQLANIAEKAGADALLVNVENLEKENKSLAKMSGSKFNITWGVSLKTVSKDEIKHLIELGCDFVVFPPTKTPAAVLTEEKIGKVLEIDTSMPDSLAKAINRLQVDAVLISPEKEGEATLTVHQLMVYERLAGTTGKHLLATIASAFSTGDLESLWGLGIQGVVMDMAVEQPEQRLSEIKEAIQRLPSRPRKPREKIRATLPLARTPSEKAETEEEEEE
jgi:hypothetical protein